MIWNIFVYCVNLSYRILLWKLFCIKNFLRCSSFSMSDTHLTLIKQPLCLLNLGWVWSMSTRLPRDQDTTTLKRQSRSTIEVWTFPSRVETITGASRKTKWSWVVSPSLVRVFVWCDYCALCLTLMLPWVERFRHETYVLRACAVDITLTTVSGGLVYIIIIMVLIMKSRMLDILTPYQIYSWCI